jgi:hypothetical protein
MRMNTDLDHLADDVPLGRVGKILGLRVVPPELLSGEAVKWSARANMIQQRVRAVGGRLYLTDRRLVFGRNKAESHLGGKEWSVDLGQLASASSGGRRSIRVERNDGRVERFIIGSPHNSAEIVDRAIHAFHKG